MPTAASLLSQLEEYRLLVAQRRLETADELFNVMCDSLRSEENGMDVQRCSDLVPSEHPEGWTPLQMSRDLQERLMTFGRQAAARDLSSVEDRELLSEELQVQIQAAQVELIELLDHLPWKRWRTYAPDHITDERLVEMRYEVIDLLHFINNMFLILGMDDEMVTAHYFAKYQRNIDRQKGSYATPAAL